MGKQFSVTWRGSKVLSDTEMKYGAPKAEMFAGVTFVEKYRAYLGSATFNLRLDNGTLSWLKTRVILVVG